MEGVGVALAETCILEEAVVLEEEGVLGGEEGELRGEGCEKGGEIAVEVVQEGLVEGEGGSGVGQLVVLRG